MKHKEIETGTYKTVGGWNAVVIWVSENKLDPRAYAIHKPETKEESVPISHHKDGTVASAFSVNEPPSYGDHPANLVIDKDVDLAISCNNLRDQLHRVARERDKERELRLVAEERRDVYLEQLANEEE